MPCVNFCFPLPGFLDYVLLVHDAERSNFICSYTAQNTRLRGRPISPRAKTGFDSQSDSDNACKSIYLWLSVTNNRQSETTHHRTIFLQVNCTKSSEHSSRCVIIPTLTLNLPHLARQDHRMMIKSLQF